MDAKGRILEYAKYKGYSVPELEKALSLGRNYFKNTAKVSLEVLTKFLSFFSEVSPDWIMFGVKPVLRENIEQVANRKEPVIVYHYTSLKGLFGIIGTRKLMLSPTKDSNDMWERNAGEDYYRFSFCTGDKAYLKSRMWAQYGSTHQGVCIAFVLEELKKKFKSGTESFYVEYEDIGKLKLVPDEDKIHYKDSDWKSENEYRIVSKEQKYIPIDLNCIEKVYIGIETENMIEKIERIGINKKLVGFMSSNLGTITISPFKYWKIDNTKVEEYDTESLSVKRYILVPEAVDVKEKDAIRNAMNYYNEFLNNDSDKSLVTYYEEHVDGSIPYYEDLPVSAGQQDLALIQATEKPSGWIKPAEVLTAIGAFPVVGCSMEPFIHQGDFVTVAPVDNWDRVDPDKVYMIITVSDRMIKHLSQDEENDEIIWGISPNYPRVKIYKNEIKAVFRITFHGKLM